MTVDVEAFDKECCVPKAFCRSDLTHASLTRSHVLKHSAGASVAAAAESGSDGACSGQALALQRLQRPGPCPSAPAAARPLPLAQAAPAAARPLPRRRLQRPGPSDLQSLSLSKKLAMRAAPTSASHLHLSSSASWRKISSSSRSCSARAHDRRTPGNVAFPERQQRPKRTPQANRA